LVFNDSDRYCLAFRSTKFRVGGWLTHPILVRCNDYSSSTATSYKKVRPFQRCNLFSRLDVKYKLNSAGLGAEMHAIDGRVRIIWLGRSSVAGAYFSLFFVPRVHGLSTSVLREIGHGKSLHSFFIRLPTSTSTIAAPNSSRNGWQTARQQSW
jgi:hypothetical protein